MLLVAPELVVYLTTMMMISFDRLVHLMMMIVVIRHLFLSVLVILVLVVVDLVVLLLESALVSVF